MYFLAHNSLMEVEVSTDPVLRVGRPRVLIDKERTKLMLWRGFAVTEDGTRFVGARQHQEDEGEGKAEDGIHVVENWFLDFED